MQPPSLKQHTRTLRQTLCEALGPQAARRWFLLLHMLWFLMAQGRIERKAYGRIELFHLLDRLHTEFPSIFPRLTAEDKRRFSERLFVDCLTKMDAALAGEEGHAETLGWLYQHYGAPERSSAFAGFRRKEKLTKETLSAATQLFTPEWVVQYLLENSLGRQLMAALGSSGAKRLRAGFCYYVDTDAPLPPATPLESITVLDPCAGSGNMLACAYDLFYRAYALSGCPEAEIPGRILTNNLFGLDTDEEVLRLARFALYLKSGCTIAPANLHAFTEPFAPDAPDDSLLPLIERFADARERGSLLQIPSGWDLSAMRRAAQAAGSADAHILSMLDAAALLQRRYTVVATNPPYISSRGMGASLKAFLAEAYPIGKSDLFSAFILRCHALCTSGGHVALFTPYVWMFIKKYEGLRRLLYEKTRIHTLIQFAYSAFSDATVPICAFVTESAAARGAGTFFNLTACPGGMDAQRTGFLLALQGRDAAKVYHVAPSTLLCIPTAPLAYWASGQMRALYARACSLQELAVPRQGLATGDNARFLRLWHEVDINQCGFHMSTRTEAKCSGKTWFPYNKGGGYRKWYGNQTYLVNWEEDGAQIRTLADGAGRPRSRAQNTAYYFRPGITWSFVNSSYFGARYSPPGFVFDVGGSTLFPKHEEDTQALLAFLCSKLCAAYLKLTNPTLNFQVGDVAALPLLPLEPKEKARIHALAGSCTALATEDWDSFETSWEFKKHPLL